ncbi:MAG: hypothetical protein EZS28_035519, partial [Streblomastix strix]
SCMIEDRRQKKVRLERYIVSFEMELMNFIELYQSFGAEIMVTNSVAELVLCGSVLISTRKAFPLAYSVFPCAQALGISPTPRLKPHE